MHIRPMHSRMAAGTPTRSLTQHHGMVGITDVDLARAAVLNLSMASQAQVGITLGQQLAVY